MKRIVCLTLCLFMLASCVASISKDISEKNIAGLKDSAQKLAQLSPFQIAYLKAAIGNDIGKLSSEAVQCLDNILLIVVTAQTDNRELTDEELGTVAGKWDRFVFLVGPDAIAWIVRLIEII